MTLDDRKELVHAVTIGGGWLFAINSERENWIDLRRPAEWVPLGHEIRLRVSDPSSLTIQEGAETFWLSISGASVSLTAGEMSGFRRGWRNLQLRAGWKSDAPAADVPYLAPQNPAEQESGDIVFLGPVYFSDSLRLGDLQRTDRTNWRASGAESLALVAAGLVAAATLGASRVSQLRDPEFRASCLSTALSDAAALAAVMTSLQLVEAYAERMFPKGLSCATG